MSIVTTYVFFDIRWKIKYTCKYVDVNKNNVFLIWHENHNIAVLFMDVDVVCDGDDGGWGDDDDSVIMILRNLMYIR